MMPTTIQVVKDGQPLSTKMVQGEDGPTTVTVLDGVPAGSSGEVAIIFVSRQLLEDATWPGELIYVYATNDV